MGGVWNVSLVSLGMEVGVALDVGGVWNVSSVNLGMDVGVADRCGRGLEY